MKSYEIRMAKYPMDQSMMGISSKNREPKTEIRTQSDIKDATKQ